MIIRCERCSTLYELDEVLLAPDGSQVQCARCQAIFVARPPRQAAPSAAEPPAAEEPARSASTPPPEPAAPPTAVEPPAQGPTGRAAEAPPARLAEPPQPRAAEPSTPRAAEAAPPRAAELGAAPEPSPERPARSAPQRPARPGPSVYRPAPPAPRPSGAKPNARTGRRSALRPGPMPVPRRPIALVAFAAVAAGLLATGAWSLWRSRPDTEGSRLAVEAAARVALDDSTSLSRGVQLYDELLVRSPALAEAEVERAVARLLMAAGQQEEAEPFADLLAANMVDRSQLDRERPPGSDEALRQLAAESARLEAELAPRRKAAEALLAQAAVELRTLASGQGREAMAARGQALQAALAGDRAEVDRLLPLARGAGPSPWPALAQAWIELRGSGSRELAMSRLAELVKARPELLRARYLLAKAQAMSGRQEEALSTLSGLLAANPRHERALRLQSQLSGPASARPRVPAPPPAEGGAAAGLGAPTTEGAAASPPGQPPGAAQAAPPPASPPTPQPSAPPPAPVASPPAPPAARQAAPAQPAPQPAPAPRPAPGTPATPATQSTPPRAAAPGPGVAPAHDGAAPVLLPAPTRIEVARPAIKAANIDAGTVQPLAPEPSPAPPAKP